MLVGSASELAGAVVSEAFHLTHSCSGEAVVLKRAE